MKIKAPELPRGRLKVRGKHDEVAKVQGYKGKDNSAGANVNRLETNSQVRSSDKVANRPY